MADATAVVLEHRSLLRLGGADRRSFLQGIVSNDVERVSPERAIWSGFLTPQGKFLHEFFVVEEQAGPEGWFLLDCEAGRAADLARRLKLYKLRARVTIEAVEDRAVTAVFGPAALSKLNLPAEAGKAAAFAGGLAFVDPRLAALGARVILPKQVVGQAVTDAGCHLRTLADYDALRIARGVPDGSRDLEVEKSTLMESGFDELNGLDWDKGCYMGQELTARMRYRGLTKKRLLPVEIAGPAPQAGTTLTRDGKEVGTLRSTVAAEDRSLGLALLRLEALEDGPPLLAGQIPVTPRKPDWAKL